MEILEQLRDEDKFAQKLTLIVGHISLLTLIIGVETILSGKGHWQLRGLVYVALLAIWSGVWTHHRMKLPKNKEKDKIGILLSLKTENDKEKLRIKNDTFTRLKELITDNNLDSHINVVLAKNYQAERLEPFFIKVAHELRKKPNDRDFETMYGWWTFQPKVKFVFYVYGSVKQRQQGENTYFIDNNMMVSHPPLDEERKNELSRLIGSIWNPQFSFQEKVEYEGFKFTAEFLYLEALYIIGSAAFASGDIGSALKLHTALENELVRLQGHPNFAYISKRLKTLLSEEHRITAYLSYVFEKDFPKANIHIGKSVNYDPENYGTYITKALLEYVYEGDPRKALQTITKAEQLAPRNDGTWRYSKGYLQMTLEKFPEAVKTYQRIASNTYSGEERTLSEVIEFNKQILEQKASHIQSLYILGFLNYAKKKDNAVALDYFDQFIRKAKLKPKYKILVNEAQKYKSKIEADNELSKSNAF